MSRIGKEPVELPSGVEFKQEGNVITLKGGKGSLSMELNSEVELTAFRQSFRDGDVGHDACAAREHGDGRIGGF